MRVAFELAARLLRRWRQWPPCQARPGADAHEAVDAATYCSWGLDYLKNDNCGAELRTPTLPSAGTSLGMAGDSASSGYLFFSPNNMISGASSTFNYGSGTSACTDAGFSAITADPGFASISSTTDLDYTTMGATFDPTAASSASSMCSAVDSAPFGDSFCKHESASTLCTSYAAVC